MSKEPSKRVILAGNFGSGNLGNECTLQAMLSNMKVLLPQAQFTCVCTAPKEAALLHDLATFPISREVGDSRWTGRKDMLSMWLRRTFHHGPREILHWIRAFRMLRHADLLVMTGTGMLSDWLTSMPLDILKWSLLAKIRRCKLAFVSVGAGPLDRPLMRMCIRLALKSADYRSYRDQHSKTFLSALGFNVNQDPVYPDLAFSLMSSALPDNNAAPYSKKRVIGIGLMGYRNKGSKSDDQSYSVYLDKIAALITWLLRMDYTIRLIIGDTVYDKGVAHDLLNSLNHRGPRWEIGRLINEEISTVAGLLEQLALCDIVVATRFHNLLLAMLLNKNVLSISYNPKNDNLMAGAGLAAYCQSIDNFDVDKEIELLQNVAKNADKLRTQTQGTCGAYRRLLNDQYLRLLNLIDLDAARVDDSGGINVQANHKYHGR